MSKETCNGNGSGFISKNGNGGNETERFLAWKHLANAGLIEGSFSGVTDGAAGSVVFASAENVPPAKITNAFFDIRDIDSGSASYAIERSGSNHINLFGTSSTFGAITPEEAWNIDTKMDDGRPALGAVFTTIGSSGAGTGCADGDTSEAEYDVQASGNLCLLNFSAF